MVERDPEASFALTVDGEAFRRAIDLFGSWIPESQLRAWAALRFDGDHLALRIGKDEARIPARGTWPGVAVTTAGFLISESAGLPDSGEIQLSVSANRIQIEVPGGRRSINCDVSPTAPEWPEFIEQQTPFTMLEYLLLPRRFSDESIEYSGLDEEVESAASNVRYVVESLHDAIYEAATTLGLDVAQVREVLNFLVGPGLEMLQGRDAATGSDVE